MLVFHARHWPDAIHHCSTSSHLVFWLSSLGTGIPRACDSGSLPAPVAILKSVDARWFIKDMNIRTKRRCSSAWGTTP